MDTTGKSQIAHEILAYLAEYPDAQDTLEGIVEWWLLAHHIKRQTATVNDALADLVATGLILAREGSNARVHYHLNRRKDQEIQVLLKQKST